ncbi:MAG TPA: kynureninase [Candidatus Marinimicrobia bacterium]|nr:kynureninase [Candidatus Neomarinimicrobiota bacterium]MDP7483681.1 kynureninase [Candidatus Neomarinimicrobiota bacterium]MDP7528547.1 kynureninase [Candidatus Neomarinimicrobiota bacterium]HJL84325.1 kynureninase [Candidatus Neomarinimicrobiota bacterium]HJM85225.1 kynureninase [Candidatus Neomarinimicrobiota bacterium]
MDTSDGLLKYREMFHIPKIANGGNSIYLVGNSLGLQPINTIQYIQQEIKTWKFLGVNGHHEGERPWGSYESTINKKMASLAGSKVDEVVTMNSLTVNLHLLMVSFYRPTQERYKIMMEAKAFPSDQYAVASQLKFHGYQPEEGIVEIEPREGETTIRTEDILKTIEKEGKSIALILIGGINYYSGQLFDMKEITRAGHVQGCVVGFDLAHAIGNVPLKLHDWDVDFAAWCNYKYINAGPGSVASVFVHNRHGENEDLPRFAGWWGHNKETRFEMPSKFDPIPGAEGWQISNLNILSAAPLLPSLDLFQEVGMDALREKSVILTGYLEYLLDQLDSEAFTIITPSDPEQRGCQLSIRFTSSGKTIHERLTGKNVMCDYREPGVIRVAPAPFYNSFDDVYRFVEILKEIV